MTSLHETLPILDDAVPALPARLEEVAKEADAFRESAGEAVAVLQARREQAETLVEQVRQALESLREQAQEEVKRVGEGAQAIERTAGEKLHELEQVTGQVTTESGEVGTALGALEASLESAAQRSRTAHEGARAAVEALGEEARNRQPELDAAVDAMTQAAKAAQQAIADGRAQVDRGVTVVKEAMDRLLAEAQARLARTHQYLQELRDEQEKAVSQALSQMEGERARLSQELEQALEDGVPRALEDEVASAAGTLAEVGQHVVELASETESRRDELAGLLDEIDGRIGPLQEAAQQVRVAADRLGIEWA